MSLKFDSFTEAYLGLARLIRDDHEYSVSPRGMPVREKLAVRFEITNPLDRVPYVYGRKFSTQYMIAELLWYFSASDKTDWIANYASFWSSITDDGVTANSAYGARMFRSHPLIGDGNLVQWNHVRDLLRDDPDSRRAVIHIKTPADGATPSLDVPCTMALQFFIRDGKLDLVVNMRSSDLILGIAYDVPAFTMMQEVMAMELGVGVGRYIHVSNSLHVYERHFAMLDEMLVNEANSLARHGKLGPMDPLPGKIPVDELYRLENRFRSTDSSKALLAALADSKLTDPYWLSWVKLLAAHRSSKLGDDVMATSLMDQVDPRLTPIR